MRKTSIAFAAAALFVANQACAAGWMKQGLWEMNTRSDAMKAMPKISPQQQEQMKKMGINVPEMKDGGMVMKICVSKEMSERDTPPDMAQHGRTGCETKNFQKSATGYSMDLVCDNENMKGTGTVKGTIAGGDSFSSVYDFKGTARGQPISTHMETSAKYLGADCGDVKPMSDYAKKKQ